MRNGVGWGVKSQYRVNSDGQDAISHGGWDAVAWGMTPMSVYVEAKDFKILPQHAVSAALNATTWLNGRRTYPRRV